MTCELRVTCELRMLWTLNLLVSNGFLYSEKFWDDNFNPLPEWNPAGCEPENQPHSICSGVMSWYIPVAFGEMWVKLCSVPGVHSSYIWIICGMNKPFTSFYCISEFLKPTCYVLSHWLPRCSFRRKQPPHFRNPRHRTSSASCGFFLDSLISLKSFTESKNSMTMCRMPRSSRKLV